MNSSRHLLPQPFGVVGGLFTNPQHFPAQLLDDARVRGLSARRKDPVLRWCRAGVPRCRSRRHALPAVRLRRLCRDARRRQARRQNGDRPQDQDPSVSSHFVRIFRGFRRGYNVVRGALFPWSNSPLSAEAGAFDAPRGALLSLHPSDTPHPPIVVEAANARALRSQELSVRAQVSSLSLIVTVLLALHPSGCAKRSPEGPAPVPASSFITQWRRTWRSSATRPSGCSYATIWSSSIPKTIASTRSPPPAGSCWP